MSNSATYFMLSKLAWIAGDLAVMMLCEKWMQLLTGHASSIVIVMLVYYATIYVSSAMLDRLPGIFRRPVLLCSLLLPGAVLLLWLAVHIGVGSPYLVYALMAMIALFSVLVTTSTSLIMDERVPSQHKPRLLSLQDMSGCVIGASAFWLGGFLLTDLPSINTALWIGAVGYTVAYGAIVLLAIQPVLESAQEAANDPMSTMNLGMIAPILLFGAYFVCKLFYTGIDPIHTVYASHVLQTGQEITFRFVGSLYIGGIIVPLFTPQLLRILNMYGVFLVLICTLVGYFAALAAQMPLVVLFVLLVLVGGAAHLLWTAILIHMHHHYSGDALARYLLWVQQGDALGPCASFLLVLGLTGPLQLDVRILTIGFAALLIVPALTLYRLQRKQHRQTNKNTLIGEINL